MLPVFRYHPDPVATGAVVESSAVCSCCSVARGYLYTGPVYSEDEIGPLCPWCIAEGVPGAMFTDAIGADDVPMTVIDEICLRTPGFVAWQQAHWLYHCGDGCEYLGQEGDEPTTYLFRCRVCGAGLSYFDFG